MKRSKKTLLSLVLLCGVMMLCVSAESVYTTQDDPLISLSYANDILSPEIAGKVMERVEAEYVKKTDIVEASAGSYTSLELSMGQTLLADGPCEVILLSGTAAAVVTSAANQKGNAGINNLTTGTVITNGTAVPMNHYLVIPKGDGRGITVTSDTITVLVRGDYHIAG